jgi:hypothetical protein
MLKLKQKANMEEEKDELNEDLDWERRTLCSDESCIGVLGPDGRCKECGKTDAGEPPENDRKTDENDAYDGDEDDAESESEDDENMDSDSDLDWENRTLCSDESCIGVIGPDGRCKECGEMFENESPPA